MFTKFIFLLCCVSALTVMVGAQGAAYTPEKDSAERKAIMSGLRAPVEKELKTKTIFEIQHLKVQGNWAFMVGVPRKASGDAMDYKGTPYEEQVDSGAFDDQIVALLKKSGANWRVVKYVIGATDVVYMDWNKTYKAPKAIFPGME